MVATRSTQSFGIVKVSDCTKHYIDASDRQELDQSLLSVCIAVDGAAKKMYPEISEVGKRLRHFVNEHIDIIELMYGGVKFKETIFPIKDAIVKLSITSADVMNENFRCNLAHGTELLAGYAVSVKISPSHQVFAIDVENDSMTLPQSAIYALGIACVLAPVNHDQRIGSYL